MLSGPAVLLPLCRRPSDGTGLTVAHSLTPSEPATHTFYSSKIKPPCSMQHSAPTSSPSRSPAPQGPGIKRKAPVFPRGRSEGLSALEGGRRSRHPGQGTTQAWGPLCPGSSQSQRPISTSSASHFVVCVQQVHTAATWGVHRRRWLCQSFIKPSKSDHVSQVAPVLFSATHCGQWPYLGSACPASMHKLACAPENR